MRAQEVSKKLSKNSRIGSFFVRRAFQKIIRENIIKSLGLMNEWQVDEEDVKQLCQLL